MPAEWIIVGLVLLAGFVPLARALRSVAARLALGILVLLGTLGGVEWQKSLSHREASRAGLLKKSPREGRPGGYVGSSSCKACHPGEFSSWHDSYHRTMTQYPDHGNVRGDFNGVTLNFDGDEYHLEKDVEGYWVEMVDPDWKYTQTLRRAAQRSGSPAGAFETGAAPPRTRKRVTLLTGSHHMQTYWVPSAFGNMQFNLPFTYVFEAERWAPRHDVFLLSPEKHYTMQIWNMNCVNCHATAGQPRQDPASKIVDSQAAEMGISCEACHGPGEAHVQANQSPGRRYKLHGRETGDPTIFNPGRADHVKASESCGQCHAVRRKLEQQEWLLTGLNFKPGEDLEKAAPLVHYEDPNTPGTPDRKRTVMEGSFWPDGQVRVSGRDFNGLADSPCFQRGKLSCLSCHSMHGYQSPAHQLAPRMESNDACLQCHPGIAGTLAAHTKHARDSPGSLCYNCHMPHTSYGLLKAIRSHKITSPTARESIETGRPNACNLCHLDQTLHWTATKLKEWHGQPLPRFSPVQSNTSYAVQTILSGDAGQRALIAWHAGWSVAIKTSRPDWLPPYLAELLTDPYSVVRYNAQRSLRRLPGHETLAYDYIGPADARSRARDQVRKTWEQSSRTTRDSSLLIHDDGSLDQSTFDSLLKQRNNRAMELLE